MSYDKSGFYPTNTIIAVSFSADVISDSVTGIGDVGTAIVLRLFSSDF